MARSIETIYNALIEEKTKFASLDALAPAIDDLQTLLNDLDSDSVVADWRLHYFVIATAIKLHEDELDNYIAALRLIQQDRYGHLRWYGEVAKQFQYGDTLTYNNGQFSYPVIDADKQIIKQAAAQDFLSGIGVALKCAKSDGADGLAKMTDAELGPFLQYILKVRPAGIPIQISNLDGDDLKLTATVYYDPELINASGELITDTSQKPALAAIKKYINFLPFNSLFNKTDFIEAVRAPEGIADMVITVAEYHVDGDVGPYVALPQNYKAAAGWMKFNEGGSTITYAAKVN